MQLTPFFKELIEKRWSEFVEMEDAETYTSSQAVVFAIVRACAEGRLPAIKESLNRIDGRLQEQIEVEYPKFYITYPHAKAVRATNKHQVSLEDGVMTIPEGDGDTPPVTGSLRDTLRRMSHEPRTLVNAILEAAEDVDQRKDYAAELSPQSDPLVKSVIVAGLLKMAHNGKLGAIFEVFDQIDGKLVDKIRVLGEDVYLTSYDTVAPAGAKLNEQGIYQMEADNVTNKWAVSLGRNNENDRISG